ncbi:MAG TPA: triple tyrosine motif-containing protein, partial [Saprospiraceae bacterium]
FMYAFYLDQQYYVHQQGLGLYKMVNDKLVLIPGSEFLGKERMQVMLPYKTTSNEKKYLIGLFYSGLFLFDGKTFQPFKTEADPIITSGSLLYKGLLLKNGTYVLSTTGKGLVIIDKEGKQLQRINREVGLQDESIYGVYQDKQSTLWLALDNGISRVETGSPLTQFTLQSGINTGVLSIERFEDALYIGTTNGLLRYDDSRNYFDLIPGIPQNQIFSLKVDSGQLLIPGDGLYGVKDKKVTTIRSSVSADLTLSYVFVSKQKPSVLLGGGPFGLAVFTRQNKSSQSSVTWDFAGYITDVKDQIWTISENNEGKFWVGSQNGYVFLVDIAFDERGKINSQKTTVEKFGEPEGLKAGVGSVYKIKGTNYFVADTCLYTFDDSQKRFVQDTNFGVFSQGGASLEFFMTADYKGRVWIRAGKETIIATPKPEGGYLLDRHQLNSLADLTIQAILPEQNGIVWFGSTDGLIRFDENVEKNTTRSFTTVIRYIAAGKHTLTSILIQSEKPQAISYTNNTLRFEYAAPFFQQEDKTTYQTWLEGFEEDWSEFDNNYYKEYTNLAAGEYTFHVRAKNIYQQLSEEAVYSFSIHPPWYRTWWAYLLYVLGALALIYSIIRWRTYQLHEKHRALEKTVEERTAQLSHRVEELAVINIVQEGLAAQMDMEGIYDLVGEKIREIFKAQVVDIAIYNKETNRLQDKYC